MAKSKTRILNLSIEKSAINEALECHFDKHKFDGICEENFSDKAWTKFCASYIKTEYADLTMKELACLVEYQIIDFLEGLLWGHRFEAVVKITPPDDFGWYWIYADISVLREDY